MLLVIPSPAPQATGYRDAGLEQLFGEFPHGIVAGEEHDAAALRRWNGQIVAGKHAGWILNIPSIDRRAGLFGQQRIGREFIAGELRQLIFVPHSLVSNARCAEPWVAETTRKSGCFKLRGIATVAPIRPRRRRYRRGRRDAISWTKL